MQELVPAIRFLETIPVKEDEKEYILLRDPSGFSDKVLAISPEVLPILSLFNGHRSLEEMAEEISRATGKPFPVDNLKVLADSMENARFLMSKTFIEERTKIESNFRLSSRRDAVMAGGGYPSEAKALHDLLNHYLDSPPPDDFEPENPPDSTITGLLLPHIDLIRGGPTYGRGYREWAKRLPDKEQGPLLVCIVGVAHSGAFSPVVVADKDFVTPLGTLPFDRPAKAMIHARLGDRPFDELWIHKNEHSIELQVIWLQHILRDHEVTFLPILTGSFPEGASGTPADNPDIQSVIETFQAIESGHEGPVLWIAGVDFAHVGPRFGDNKPVENSLESSVAKRDMEALETVRAADSEAWWKSIMSDENQRRVCGLYATYIFLEMIKGSQGFICDYQQATSKERDQMVSFASAVFTRMEEPE